MSIPEYSAACYLAPSVQSSSVNLRPCCCKAHISWLILKFILTILCRQICFVFVFFFKKNIYRACKKVQNKRNSFPWIHCQDYDLIRLQGPQIIVWLIVILTVGSSYWQGLWASSMISCGVCVLLLVNSLGGWQQTPCSIWPLTLSVHCSSPGGPMFDLTLTLSKQQPLANQITGQPLYNTIICQCCVNLAAPVDMKQ